jgi:hypothetical protein
MFISLDESKEAKMNEKTQNRLISADMDFFQKKSIMIQKDKCLMPELP